MLKPTKSISFKTRKKGLKKKVQELSTLCNVEACLLLFEGKQSGVTKSTCLWPDNPTEFERIVNRYRRSRIKDEDKKEGQGHQAEAEAGIFSSCSAAADELFEEKMKKKYTDQEEAAEYVTWDPVYDSFTEEQLKGLLGKLDCMIEAVETKYSWCNRPNPPILV